MHKKRQVLAPAGRMAPLTRFSSMRRDEDPETHTPSTPPSPGSYILPLLLVVLACAGYVFWRRRRNSTTGAFGLSTFSKAPAAVRLSIDDGPSSHSFIPANDSTDSLPTHALTDLPVLPDSLRQATHPALRSQSHSPIPSYTPPSSLPSTGLNLGGITGRRSARSRGPVEGDQGESDSEGEGESEVEVGTGKKAEQLFEIGDEEDDVGSSPGRTRR